MVYSENSNPTKIIHEITINLTGELQSKERGENPLVSSLYLTNKTFQGAEKMKLKILDANKRGKGS